MKQSNAPAQLYEISGKAKGLSECIIRRNSFHLVQRLYCASERLLESSKFLLLTHEYTASDGSL